eukprot:692402-Pyramimonas_sp.AAC.1
MPVVSHAQMLAEFEAADRLARDLLLSVGAKLAVVITAEAESLDNKVPNYAPYCVDVFDTDRVKENIVAKQWDGFAASW